jgi:glucose/arabinose dehydrogenase
MNFTYPPSISLSKGVRMAQLLAKLSAIATATLLVGLNCANAQEMKTPGQTTYSVFTLKPAPLEATDENIQSVHLPTGFHIAKFVDGLDHPRVLLATPNDTLYVSSREAGTITLIKFVNGSLVKQQVAASKDVHGLAMRNNELYYVTIHDVFVAPIHGDGTLGDSRKIISGLPGGGQHADRTIAFGPDGWLYISVGSTCNECEERNPQNATMLRSHADGSGLETIATGLRNTIGFAFQPGNGTLYGFDDGVDWLGNDAQREELNLIENGKKYGWPYIFGDGQKNAYREPPLKKTLDDWDKSSQRPVLTWSAHAASMQLMFYTGTMFPSAFRGDAFATMHGSWNRNPPSGYEIVRIHFEDGKPQKIEPFAEGFLMKKNGQWARFARPFGLAQLKDGSILMGDEQNGVIYRISYRDK